MEKPSLFKWLGVWSDKLALEDARVSVAEQSSQVGVTEG